MTATAPPKVCGDTAAYINQLRAARDELIMVLESRAAIRPNLIESIRWIVRDEIERAAANG